MEKRNACASDGRGGPGARFGVRAVAAVAALSLAASMWPVAPALGDEQIIGAPALADGQPATAPTGLEEQGYDEGALLSQAEAVTEVNSDTHRLSSGTYKVTKSSVVIRPDETGNGIQVEKGARVVLHIEGGSMLKVFGRNAKDDPEGVGRAAILLPEGSTLIVIGGVNAQLDVTGGAGGKGADGGDAGASSCSGSLPRTGDGGRGGDGGGGAGAGIGTDGGKGGAGGAGGAGISSGEMVTSNRYGNDGRPGSAGSPAEPAGTLLVQGGMFVTSYGGIGGKGGMAGKRGFYDQKREWNVGTAAGTSGGGGAGAGGSAAHAVGSGGSGGGGGGGGASGNLDGEVAGLIADLDDLWGHGGQGGTSVWGGDPGANGDEGASNGGDDTGYSKKYARAGGAGGTNTEPKSVVAYGCGDPKTSRLKPGGLKPTFTLKSGNDKTDKVTMLPDLDAFAKLGNGANTVGGGTHEYDGQAHGVTVNGAAAQSDVALGAQDEDEGVGYTESGTTQIDGITVTYSVAYYDESGARLDGAPVMPGSYAALVTLECDENPDYNGSWVEPITIAKRQVAKPTPAALTFECEDWTTGEGALQDAFPGLADKDYEFVAAASTDDGAASTRSARAAGEYEACFRLKEPETCEWADGSGPAECWVPWSIALQEFDPNDVSYWGTAYDKPTTSVAHTGEPQWVRPWFTYARGTDGRFPEWLTHWGSADRPTTDRASAVVAYLRGEGDREGLVGYHTGSDGSLEPVTALQVYAWMFGVDVDGQHVTVESGDTVWYRADGDEVTVLSVQRAAGESALSAQADAPEGATGSVVARDLAWADRLGVRDPGTYQAYAYFDEGAGFAPTALAEATVEVRAAEVPAPASNSTTTNNTAPRTTAPATGTATRAATAVPATADASAPGALAAALLGSGALALARRRRS